MKSLGDFYEKFPKITEVKEANFELYFFSHNLIKDKDRELYQGIFSQLKTLSVEEEEIESILGSLKTRSIAGELALASYGVSEGSKTMEDLYEVWERFDQPLNDEIHDFVTDDLEELYEQTISTPGLRWRLAVLNRMLGSLRRGDFGFIFARPETGKTTFLASEVSYFATQCERPILWFNNEEQGNKVKIRLYQASLGVQLHELMSDRQGNKQAFLENTGGRIRLIDSAAIHRRDVESLCESLKPALIVIDQIDKLKGFQDDRDDLRLGSIYIWAREIAKQYCPVIAVCQAGGTGEGKKWLTMDDVVNAKTSKQAEADFILGIGKTHNEDEEYSRYINICKNKLQGDTDSNPAERHGKAVVVIQPEIARYKDVK